LQRLRRTGQPAEHCADHYDSRFVGEIHELPPWRAGLSSNRPTIEAPRLRPILDEHHRTNTLIHGLSEFSRVGSFKVAYDGLPRSGLARAAGHFSHLLRQGSRGLVLGLDLHRKGDNSERRKARKRDERADYLRGILHDAEQMRSRPITSAYETTRAIK
jgi:hypothetical protein